MLLFHCVDCVDCFCSNVLQTESNKVVFSCSLVSFYTVIRVCFCWYKEVSGLLPRGSHQQPYSRLRLHHFLVSLEGDC